MAVEYVLVPPAATESWMPEKPVIPPSPTAMNLAALAPALAPAPELATLPATGLITAPVLLPAVFVSAQLNAPMRPCVIHPALVKLPPIKPTVHLAMTAIPALPLTLAPMALAAGLIFVPLQT